MINRSEFASNLSKGGLSHLERAIGFLWFYSDNKIYSERTTADLVNDMSEAGFASENESRLRKNLLKSKFIVKGKSPDSFRINHRFITQINEKYAKFSNKSGSVLIIDPTNPINAIISFHDIMKNLKGDISICDPYLDKTSLNYLDSISVQNKIYLLSQKITIDGEFNSILLGLRKKGLQLDIRKTNKRILHDRYVIDSKNIYFLGTSLNGIGNTQSFIFKMESEIRNSVELIFQSNWRSSTITNL